MANEFVPFELTDPTIESFDRLVEDQAEKGLAFTNPFDERMQDKIKSLTELMKGKPLNQDFNIDAKDFFYPEPKKKDEAPLPAEEGEVWEKTSLPPTSMPKVAAIPAQKNPIDFVYLATQVMNMCLHMLQMIVLNVSHISFNTCDVSL